MTAAYAVSSTGASNLQRATHEPPHVSLRGDAIVANRGLLRIEEAAMWLGFGRTKRMSLSSGAPSPA
jgi:hypothetical protein